MNSLPIELTDQIISLLPKRSQLSVRLVNRRLCELATASVFREVTTYFCEESLNRLENIASTPRLARHVRSFEYAFVGVYSTLMSFVHFKTMLAPPGRAYHGEHMKTFYTHYKEQFTEHSSLLPLEPRILRRAMCAFPHLRCATLRYGKYDHAYNDESWSYTLKNVPLGGKRAHKALTEALARRAETGGGGGGDVMPLEKLSATGIPQMPFDELLSFGRGVGDGGLVEMLTTVNIHIARQKKEAYARFPRKIEGEDVLLADVVSRMRNIVNLRFWMDDCDTVYCNDGYIPRFPISRAHASLSVLFVQGFKFLEGDLVPFIERQGASMKGLFVSDVAVIGRGAGDAVERVLSALSSAGVVVSLFEAPVYTGIEGQELVLSPVSSEEFGRSPGDQRWEVKRGFERSLFGVV
ncbi:hypothetical protein HOY82DRAFT_548950 [Tuber indicum]|nr:hypothetical protein HOY82DRAFT_548950 [Tuber indicum]